MQIVQAIPMTIQRVGTTEGMQAIPGIKAIPIISFALVHNGGAQRRSGGRSHASLRSTPSVAFGLRRTDLHSFP
jgi:hypothetical protein